MAYRFIVLGAGISGLTCAWYLKKRFGSTANIVILEKSDRPGGCIRTISSEGFLFEQGPRSLRTQGSGVHTLQLIEELGMSSQIIFADAQAHTRYLYNDSQLRKVPTGLLSFLFSPLTRSLILPFLREYLIPPFSEEDESIYSFISRRLNSDIAENLVDPVVSGIYAGNIRELSVRSCFPKLHQYEQVYGSILKGILKTKKAKNGQKAALFSLQGGIEDLIQELVQQLNVEMHFLTCVDSLELHGSSISVHVNSANSNDNKDELEADYVFSTLPVKELERITKSWSCKSRLLSLSDSIAHASLSVVNLGYRRNVLPKKGFGYLVPQKEKESILGCVWDSCVFPQQNSSAEETRLTVMLGGMHHPHVSSFPEQKQIALALEALERHIGITAVPDHIRVKNSYEIIPQYKLGFDKKKQDFLKSIIGVSKRLVVSGNVFTGVSVNDCVAANKKIVQEFL